MLKRMRRIGLFVLAIAVVISSAIIASANERSSNTGSATVQSTASSYVIENHSQLYPHTKAAWWEKRYYSYNSTL